MTLIIHAHGLYTGPMNRGRANHPMRRALEPRRPVLCGLLWRTNTDRSLAQAPLAGGRNTGARAACPASVGPQWQSCAKWAGLFASAQTSALPVADMSPQPLNTATFGHANCGPCARMARQMPLPRVIQDAFSRRIWNETKKTYATRSPEPTPPTARAFDLNIA